MLAVTDTGSKALASASAVTDRGQSACLLWLAGWAGQAHLGITAR